MLPDIWTTQCIDQEVVRMTYEEAYRNIMERSWAAAGPRTEQVVEIFRRGMSFENTRNTLSMIVSSHNREFVNTSPVSSIAFKVIEDNAYRPCYRYYILDMHGEGTNLEVHYCTKCDAFFKSLEDLMEHGKYHQAETSTCVEHDNDFSITISDEYSECHSCNVLRRHPSYIDFSEYNGCLFINPNVARKLANWLLESADYSEKHRRVMNGGANVRHVDGSEELPTAPQRV
jgi:hypothetical protein